MAIVGTRGAVGLRRSRSRTARARARRRPGITVVSGMALGDRRRRAPRRARRAAGRRSRCSPAGRTCAYPRRHRASTAQIARAGSSSPSCRPASAPLPLELSRRATGSWPRSAQMTVVVEAARAVGLADHRATSRSDLGREVGAVPGQVTTRAGRRAATRCSPTAPRVVRGAQDVLDELFGVGAGAAAATRPPSRDARCRLERRLLDAVEARRRHRRRSPTSPGCRSREVRAALGAARGASG